MVIPIIKAKPGHLAAIMVMCCSVTVGQSVQLLLCLIQYWKRVLLGFGLKSHGLEIEKVCGNATWPRYRGWKEPHHLESVTQDCSVVLNCKQQLHPWIYPQSEWQSLLTTDQLLRPFHPCLPRQITFSFSKDKNSPTFIQTSMIKTGTSLSSKPLHLPVSSRSGCAPCPPRSICCL